MSSVLSCRTSRRLRAGFAGSVDCSSSTCPRKHVVMGAHVASAITVCVIFIAKLDLPPLRLLTVWSCHSPCEIWPQSKKSSRRVPSERGAATSIVVVQLLLNTNLLLPYGIESSNSYPHETDSLSAACGDLCVWRCVDDRLPHVGCLARIRTHLAPSEDNNHEDPCNIFINILGYLAVVLAIGSPPRWRQRVLRSFASRRFPSILRHLSLASRRRLLCQTMQALQGHRRWQGC